MRLAIRLAVAVAVIALLGLIVWAGVFAYREAPGPAKSSVPTTTVKRGVMVVTVTARGDLQGGNSEMLTAPMTGGNDMTITVLRKPGEIVEAGDVVAQFDTMEQEFKLKEAEADLAQAGQHLIQARAEAEAREEEAGAALIQARADLRVAELETRRNPLLAAIVARQNLLAVEAARDKVQKLEKDLDNRKATSAAGIAIHEAARNKAKIQADTARRNIEAMTLKARRRGYVNVQQNTNGSFMWGMHLPMLQVGDSIRAGMAVVQIPDLETWEVTARVGELDRGHLSVGQPAVVTVVALPARQFKGKIKNIGGTTGPPWDRYFECKLSLENPAPELRPGMTAHIVITTATLADALWVPSHAIFDSDGRKYVYVRSRSGFTPKDIELVRRSESQVALTGLQEGQIVALAKPEQAAESAKQSSGAMQAIQR
ncbi:MAG: efflux RND transporter periplasmic adaptor subunit [Acidobacteria bacterium]|nr:efflux RND transporter periplasmic adaptor subunit [Acidobacteriota bacterium]MBI3281573.1 efflux RND transporter periplasmic adaptor subunit [Acidobacteriota bacterium]